MTQYSATTRGVRIQVTPVFLDDQSDPDENDFMWAYTVEIANLSEKTVQLTARTWKIIDHHGVTHVVQGPGVVGEQPILREGDSFTYTSGCPLSTPSGLMMGSYLMQTDDGETFEAQVPTFSLDSPFEIRSVN
ncbi:Co2+/Mg2+ efflux protein ApaG [Aquidulcibacter paucihalophilus]|uniref:Co2+/Mg2+ efflux protein ApaG n=1 Tax=Aquidulcibacter paucihalophilus TaxID=1978549 RepID=UPI000A18A5DC|nr:Co2+/Mg2+ efflux protein ApaG [Aquidulcibacter paucihalophilus]